ncbi:hypothetical protein LCGC14_2638410 [marine sediment metagenome]|uniref:Uncharacterized protein n=1 Tax=marine sediment metagenome TaxID=412755 RepID=A0A0F8ZYF7_9ZZZZ
MDERKILDRILELREKQEKSTKFVGSLTTELIRKELLRQGLNVSNRDVFIERISNEFDLLILKPDSKPKENLLYNPRDVLFCLEIKFRGSYAQKGINQIKNTFDKVKNINDKIKCIYLTISESRKYKYRITKERIGNEHECFELFTRDTPLEKALESNTLKLTGDWNKFLESLKTH